VRVKRRRGEAILQALSRIRADEAGEVAISYGLIAALISVAAIIAMSQLGDTIPHAFDFVTQTMRDGLARMGLL
jgi:pilus assembly protein Flp/PilA